MKILQTKFVLAAFIILPTTGTTAIGQRQGYLGIAISCSNCSWKTSATTSIWRFSASPAVEAIDTLGPAARSGIRAGDVITAIDGLALTTDAGARRFSEVAPGQSYSLSVHGRTQARTVLIVATERPDGMGRALAESLRAAGEAIAITRRGPAADSPIRFSGTIAGLDVVVRGSPDVTVLLDDQECGAVFLTATTRIQLKSPRGCAKP
jgi:membrane-associated protease RseP (regulator of RpoE activity)